MIIKILIAFIGSAGAFSFIQFLISRKDTQRSLLKKIVEDISALHEEMCRDRAVNARIRILSASDEVLHGVEHSLEWWNQVNEDITGYDKYCETHPDFKNNKAVMAIDHLNKTYSERLEKNDFI